MYCQLYSAEDNDHKEEQLYSADDKDNDGEDYVDHKHIDNDDNDDILDMDIDSARKNSGPAFQRTRTAANYKLRRETRGLM